MHFRHVHLVWVLFALMCAPSVWAQTTPVKAALISEASTITDGKSFRVAVKVDHAPTYHTYGKKLTPGVTGLPTTVKWKLPEGWTAADLTWPVPHELVTTGNIKSEGYEGTVYLPYEITPAPGQAIGAKLKLEGTYSALACDPKSCVPVRLPISVEVEVGPTLVANSTHAEAFQDLPTADSATPASNTPNEEQKSLGLMLLYGFLGGLILNIMPCVFPVLGIKITSIVSQSGEDKQAIKWHGLAYTLGVLGSFWVLVAVLQAFDITWGGQFQNPVFVYAVVLLFTIFGLNMAGLFEIGTSAVGVGSGLMRSPTLKGSFFSGLLATVVSTPCSAPFLAPALLYGLGLSLFPSLLFFSVIGLGLAFPFLALSFFPALLKKLPRPGPWMESFKQAMSFLMIGAAFFFVWTLQHQVSEDGKRNVLLGLTLVAAACWIYGRWCHLGKATKTRVKAGTFALLFLSLGIWLGWPQPKDTRWKEWSPETFAALRAEGKPIYIDFTAHWCVTCQWNKWVYKEKEIETEIKDRGIVLLKADWSEYDDRITKALAELGYNSVPVNALYIPGKDKPIILPSVLTVSNVRNALSEVTPQVAVSAR